MSDSIKPTEELKSKIKKKLDDIKRLERNPEERKKKEMPPVSTFDNSIPICAITHQEINRPLKTLVPNDPNLASAIVSWLQARGEENVS